VVVGPVDVDRVLADDADRARADAVGHRFGSSSGTPDISSTQAAQRQASRSARAGKLDTCSSSQVMVIAERSSPTISIGIGMSRAMWHRGARIATTQARLGACRRLCTHRLFTAPPRARGRHGRRVLCRRRAGGQHRNKTETGVRLHHAPSGVIVTATERRSRIANLEAAWERLRARLAQLNVVPKKRHATKPTRGSKERRLVGKAHDAVRKQARRRPAGDD